MQVKKVLVAFYRNGLRSILYELEDYQIMHFQAFIRAVLRSCDLRLSDFCINETIRTSICGTDRSFYRCDVINSDHWRLYWMLGRGLIDLYGRLETGYHFYHHVRCCTTI